MKPTLVILAAGMGSRYGKLKQMDSFGPNGETIIDYSLYDAINAGFGKVVFIVRDFFKQEFETYFRNKLAGKIEMEFVCQELNLVPEHTSYHPERLKPWGTAHAIWVAKNVVNEPFGVINADDYYGVDAYKQLADYLISSHENNSTSYSVIAYYLRNTLSDHGTVNRGVCNKDIHGHLVDVKECVKIKRDADGAITYPEGDSFASLTEDTLVSMNMWGFLPSYFKLCEEMFVSFLATSGMELTSEFYIPTLVDYLIKNQILHVDVIDTESDWFGVTYQEDKPFVMDKIKDLLDHNVYPHNLWS